MRAGALTHVRSQAALHVRATHHRRPRHSHSAPTPAPSHSLCLWPSPPALSLPALRGLERGGCRMRAGALTHVRSQAALHVRAAHHRRPRHSRSAPTPAPQQQIGGPRCCTARESLPRPRTTAPTFLQPLFSPRPCLPSSRRTPSRPAQPIRPPVPSRPMPRRRSRPRGSRAPSRCENSAGPCPAPADRARLRRAPIARAPCIGPLLPPPRRLLPRTASLLSTPPRRALPPCLTSDLYFPPSPQPTARPPPPPAARLRG